MIFVCTYLYYLYMCTIFILLYLIAMLIIVFCSDLVACFPYCFYSFCLFVDMFVLVLFTSGETSGKLPGMRVLLVLLLLFLFVDMFVLVFFNSGRTSGKLPGTSGNACFFCVAIIKLN